MEMNSNDPRVKEWLIVGAVLAALWVLWELLGKV
jgi:hypothetical protein